MDLKDRYNDIGEKAKKSAIKKWIIGLCVGAFAHLCIIMIPVAIGMIMFNLLFTTVLDTDDADLYTDINVYHNVNGWYKQDRQGYTAYFVTSDQIDDSEETKDEE